MPTKEEEFELRLLELAEQRRANDLRELEIKRASAVQTAAEEQLDPQLAIARQRERATIRDPRLMPIHVLYRTREGLPVNIHNSSVLELARGITSFFENECHAAVATLTPRRSAPGWRIQSACVGRYALSPQLEKRLHAAVYTPAIERDLANGSLRGGEALRETLRHQRKLMTGPLGAAFLLGTFASKMLADVRGKLVPLAILEDPNAWPIADADLWDAPAIEIPAAPSWNDAAAEVSS